MNVVPPLPEPRRHREQELRCLWSRLTERLDAWRTDWETLIDKAAGTVGIEWLFDPAASDKEIFEAFAIALLSGNTRWDRIARIRDALRIPFADFDPRRFAALSNHDIEQKIVPWFRERKAGAAGLRAGLLRLRLAAAKLINHGPGRSSGVAYLRDAFSESDGTPEDLAVMLGTSKKWKLPGFGVALAAEALRNLGIDLCKPDRHILRAVGSWSLIEFSRWDRRGVFTPPAASTAELQAAMFAVRAIAEAAGRSVSYTNSAIWLAGAVSGARLANADFEEIGRACAPGIKGRTRKSP